MKITYPAIILIIAFICVGCTKEDKIIIHRDNPISSKNSLNLIIHYSLEKIDMFGEVFLTSSEQHIGFSLNEINGKEYCLPTGNHISYGWGNGFYGHSEPLKIKYYKFNDELNFEILFKNVISREFHERNKIENNLFNSMISDSLNNFFLNTNSQLDTISFLGRGEIADRNNQDFSFDVLIQGVLSDSMTIIKHNTNFDNNKIEELRSIINQGEYELSLTRNFVDTIFLF